MLTFRATIDQFIWRCKSHGTAVAITIDQIIIKVFRFLLYI